LVATLSRFQALADLGRTAKIVVVRDCDTLWSQEDRNNIRAFQRAPDKLYQRYVAGRVCKGKYAWPVWGGGLAVKYSCKVGSVKRHFDKQLLNIEVTIHRFCAEHMRNPRIMMADPRIASQFVEKKSVTTARRKKSYFDKQNQLQIDMFPYGCDQVFLQVRSAPRTITAKIV
jgi:hypothetical protein